MDPNDIAKAMGDDIDGNDLKSTSQNPQKLDEFEPPSGWKVKHGRLQRFVELADYDSALGFVREIIEMSDQEGHHPNITMEYSCNDGIAVGVIFFTRDEEGGIITENDVIMAEKTNEIIEANI